MRTIDADELVKKVSEESVHKLKQAWNDDAAAEARGMVMAIGCIKNAPTVDAVKHGSWEDVGFKDFMCSECGIILGGAYCYVYCPHCGTKMDGGKNGC